MTYSLNPCDIPEQQQVPNLDPKLKNCPPLDKPSLNDIPFLDTNETIQTGKIGASGACSPMQSGKIISDPDNVDRGIINRYSQTIKGCDMAVRDLFSDVYLIDVNGQAVKVPILLAPGEKAVIAALNLPGSGMRHDNSLVTDRITLPIMSIYSSGMSLNDSRYTYEMINRPMNYASEKYTNDTIYSTNRGVPVDREYTLTAWTFYMEDMSQLLEVIMNKLNRMTYVHIQGVNWEVPVRLTGIQNNVTNDDIGDDKVRIIKYQFNMVAETYIAQPILRGKSILKVITDYVSGTPENIQEIVNTTTVES